MGQDGNDHVAVTYENCEQISGPFFHGTKSVVEIGDELVAGAELATALAGDEGRGHIYEVEPLGPFEDDPNVTNKRFPGNPTQSYRTRHPLRVVGEVTSWEGHSPEVLNDMLDRLALLREQGLDLIED